MRAAIWPKKVNKLSAATYDLVMSINEETDVHPSCSGEMTTKLTLFPHGRGKHTVFS